MSFSTSRPRNVDWKKAAAILYGDWGTSKAYVLGLAFAVAGYSSFWLILPMCLLVGLVGINYITVCRLYPNGGGVYASVRDRSQVISIVGAFLLIADYLVTAALSALAAFHYLGVTHPALWAGGAILVIGALNFFGPKKTGALAVMVSIPTVLTVITLAFFSLPHLKTAWSHLQPLQGSFGNHWMGFIGIVLALSGVEAIANSTGIMKLDPGTSSNNPCVKKTATKAILVVVIEVSLFTALLGFAMLALPELTVAHGEVNGPGATGVRDYMLRYMGEIFIGNIFGTTVGQIAGWIVSITFGFLLLSAVNTAIIALISLSFLMAKDKEIPPLFAKLNRFGVPPFSLLLLTLIPAALVVLIGDVSALADLYAVGVIGAIATNLGATASNSKLQLSRRERLLMWITFGILVAIEITLFIEKPKARIFVLTILVIGLILRSLAKECTDRATNSASLLHSSSSPPKPAQHEDSQAMEEEKKHHAGPILAAVKAKGRTLNFALREARETGRPLYILFVRQQPILTPEDYQKKWQDDPGARLLFESLEPKAQAALGKTIFPCYAVSDSPKDTIADFASTIGTERLIIGASRRGALLSILQGNMVKNLSKSISEEIDLIVCG